MEKDLICPICGQPTRVYMGNARKDRLCGTHANALKAGKIYLDDEGLFHDADTKKVLNSDEKNKDSNNVGFADIVNDFINVNKTNSCVLCGSDSRGKPLCKNCYYDCQDMEDEIDRNKKPFELKDYYFNLKSANYRVVNKNSILRNTKMMIALANVIYDSYDDSSLVDRVFKDVTEILSSAEKKKEVKETAYTEQADSQKSAIMRTLDGHIVKSQPEVIIDNILYNNFLPHCYEKDVIEISSAERTLKSDWFIPVVANKGIYIEYWGMDKPDYLKNKEEKRKLYKENNIPLIEIEKDDIKDSTGLNARIMREYAKLKKEIKDSF